MLLEGEMHIGPKVVNPDPLGLTFQAGRALIKKDRVGLDARFVVDASGQTENGVKVGAQISSSFIRMVSSASPPKST